MNNESWQLRKLLSGIVWLHCTAQFFLVAFRVLVAFRGLKCAGHVN